MATTNDVSFTKEKSNYLRLCRAIIDLGTEVLRLILSQSVNPNDIIQYVKRAKLKLQPHQKNTLTTICGDYKELDISFLYFLIRNLCIHLKPTRGWNPSSPPASLEVTLGDDVERIHFLRNYIYGHVNETSVSDQAFQDHWMELEELMARMDVLFCSNFQQSLLTVQIDTMDLETIKKGHLKDLKQQIIEKWDTDEKSFCETEASKKVTNVVKNNTLTVITGPPGSGKSAIAHHIATTLQNQDYQIVPVTSVEDLEHSWVQGSKQVFVLDDVFGVHKLNESEIDNWYQRRERSKICFQNNKIILTMRNQYSHSTRLQALLSEYQYFLLDITRKDLLLSQKEKRSMFMKHMSGAPKRSNCNDTVKNCEFLFFPLLCRLFATDNESKYDLNLFFKNPLSVLKTEFELLRENKDGKYLGLVLCVIYDNKLAESHLDIGDESKETKHLRKDFAECCGLSRSISRQEIKQNLDSLLGTYVLKESGFYKFTHAIIYDVVLSTLTSEFQSSILKHCSLQFIIQRVILYSSESKDQGFVILNDNFKPNLVNRLISDITKGNVLDVLKNTCLKNEAIEELFLYQLKTKCTLGKEDFIKYTSRSEPQLNSDMEHLYFYDDVAVQRRKSKRFLFLKCTINFSPVHLIVANQMNKTFHYVYDLLSSSEQNSLLTDDTIMKVAALYGNQKVFELCLEKTRTLENFDLLYCSVTGGHVEIVRQILEKRPKVVMFLLPCLKRASRLGYNKIVKLLIRNGADPNTCDNDGLTALHFASQTGQNKTAQLLIKNGAIIDRPDNDGQTPLHTASFHGHYKTVQTLLTNGAVINICDKNDVTALHAASENGHDNTVQLLIKNGATVDKCNVYGITALFMASKNGHDSTVKILVDNGADVDIYDKNGITALHAASENGHDNTVQLLIKNGASVDKCNIYGITALQMASHNGHDTTVQTLINNDASINKCNNAALIAALLNGHDSTIKVLLDNGASANHVFNNAFSALHLASTQENVSTVQLLIDNGASVDKEFKDGSTALHFASEKGYDRIVQTLIDNDADINKCNNDGHTALHLASLKRYESTVKKLIDNGANVNKCENNGQTSLQIASYNGHDSIVQKLIDKGASVNKSDLKGYTALHTASQNGHNSTVQLLIDNGASVDKEFKDGSTALHFASEKGYDRIVQTLIDNDADINKCNTDGLTALHLASLKRYDSTVKKLIDNGANVNKCENNGQTSLQIASYHGHDSIVQKLIDKGASVNKSDLNGYTALHAASQNGHNSTIQLLIDNGASVNKSNTNGCTALHLASGNGHNSTVQILIDNDASVNYGYKDGFTALHLASQYGHDSTVQILIDNGANVDEWGNVGFTALHLASKNGHDSTVKTLIDNGVKLPNLLVALTIALSNNYSKIADILFDHCYKRRLMLIAALLFQLYRKNMNEKEKLNKEILRVDYILSLKI